MAAPNAPHAKQPTNTPAAAEADAQGILPPPASQVVQDRQQELQREIDAEDAQMRHESAM